MRLRPFNDIVNIYWRWA